MTMNSVVKTTTGAAYRNQINPPSSASIRSLRARMTPSVMPQSPVANSATRISAVVTTKSAGDSTGRVRTFNAAWVNGGVNTE